MQDEMNGYRCRDAAGAQWGDEGKGRVEDAEASVGGVVARYQGGADGGHTVDVGGEEVILHQMPPGIVREGKRWRHGKGVGLDIEQFFAELAGPEPRGIDAEWRVGVSA